MPFLVSVFLILSVSLPTDVNYWMPAPDCGEAGTLFPSRGEQKILKLSIFCWSNEMRDNPLDARANVTALRGKRGGGRGETPHEIAVLTRAPSSVLRIFEIKTRFKSWTNSSSIVHPRELSHKVSPPSTSQLLLFLCCRAARIRNTQQLLTQQ